MSLTFQNAGHTSVTMTAALTVVHDTDRECLRAFREHVFLAAMMLREKDACGLLLTEMQTVLLSD